MMHFVNVFLLIPKTIWLVNKNEVFIFVVDHSRHIVKVHVLQEYHKRKHICSVSWANNSSLITILKIHNFVVITVTNLFKAPATSVLELLRNLPPIEVVRHPAERRHSVALIALENVEARVSSESSDSHNFPESNPLNEFSVFINGLSLSEVKSRIRIHGRSLYEGLELVTRVSRCSLDTENALNWFFAEHGVAQTISYVREFLVVFPLDLPLVTSVVVVVSSGGEALLVLSMV